MSYLEQNQDDEKIISFSETQPAEYKPFTRSDLEEAEDQTEEIEEAKDQEDEEKSADDNDIKADEFDEQSLDSMSLGVLSVVRFMPRHRSKLEYGTPAGIEPPITGTCPSCADAADAAIIDNEIGEDKPSEEPGAKEDVEKRKASVEGGGDEGGEGDLSADSIGESGSEFGDEGGDLGDTSEPGEDEGFGEAEEAPAKGNDESQGDENADAGGELMKYVSLKKAEYQKRLTEQYLYGNEAYWHDTDPVEEYVAESRKKAVVNFLGTILNVISKITIKLANIANKIYMSCRDLIAKNFVKKTTIHKFLDFKLNKLIDAVDEQRLMEYKATAYPFQDWIDTAKVALTMYGAVLNCKTLIYDDPSELLSPKLAKLKSLMEECGITISTSHNSVNIDASLDKRKNETLGELGYSKKEIPNLVRYFGEIAKRLPDKKSNKLEDITSLQIEHIGHLRSDFEKNVKSGKYKKGSEEAERAEKALIAYATRMDYILLMQKGVFLLFDVLLSDMMTICRRVEDSMEASALID